MGSGRFDAKIPDLFSAPAREQAALPSKPPNSTAENGAASPRHVLPNDLPTAIKHLGDQELDQLQAAVTAEQQRRGRKRIILIDGKELARLMVQYGVGVRIERTVEIKRIDLDYF